MARIPAGVPQTRGSFAIESLSERQQEILSLYFIEGMKQFRIAQQLRIHPKTVSRDIAAALEILRTSEEDLRADMAQQSGPVRMGVTIAFAPDDVKFRYDATLITVSKLLTVPGFRVAYYAPDSSPERIKAIHARMEGQPLKKPKKRIA